MVLLQYWNDENDIKEIQVALSFEIVYKAIECINFLSYSEIQEFCIIDNFDEFYSTLLDYEHINVFLIEIID
jgi:hypothetical protein